MGFWDSSILACKEGDQTSQFKHASGITAVLEPQENTCEHTDLPLGLHVVRNKADALASTRTTPCDSSLTRKELDQATNPQH